MNHLFPLGLKVSDFSEKELEHFVVDAIQNKSAKVVFGYSLGYITLYKKHSELFRFVNNFDLMLCDGVPFYWFLKSIGFKLKEVISIPEFCEWIIHKADNYGWSILILGGTEEINQLATANTRIKYPNAKVLEGRNGYFNLEEDEEIVDHINGMKPDILLVAMSTPKKEEFVIKNNLKLNASIIIPCGGMVDVLAGKTNRSPKWIKKLGLATFYRIAQEPRRLLITHMTMVWEAMFKLLPIAWWNIFVLRKDGKEVLTRYLKKEL